MAPRYALARRKAMELLREAKVRHAPVPVERLAGIAGASINFVPFEGTVSGMIHRQPDGSAIIGVNPVHSVNRQRFTIAHEIGHLVLHKDEILHVDERFPIAFRDHESSLATKDSEIEANQFAAELLMPVDVLSKEIKRLREGIEVEDAVIRLAEIFQVSEQAMTLRLTRLGVLDPQN